MPMMKNSRDGALSTVVDVTSTNDVAVTRTTTTNDDDDDDDADATTAHYPGRTITLVSNDDRTFHVPFKAAKLSGFIVDTLGLEDEDNDDDDDDAEDNEDDDDERENPFNKDVETTSNPLPRVTTTKQYEPIIIPRVNGKTLQRIVDFLLHYTYVNPMPKIQQPIVAETFLEVMPDVWYQQYVMPPPPPPHQQRHHEEQQEDNRTTVFQILEAANFMEIAPILDLTCLWCTFQISGKSTEEIRVFLNLPKMTPEEEAQARAEHPWIFESISPS